MPYASIVYGSAFPDDAPIKSTENVRAYIIDGKQYIGHESFDIAHVCSVACRQRILTTRDDSAWLGTEDGWQVTENNASAYVSTSRTRSGNVITADVGPFDRGDDPYVKCSACGEEMYRDDEEYEAQYGRPIGT